MMAGNIFSLGYSFAILHKLRYQIKILISNRVLSSISYAVIYVLQNGTRAEGGHFQLKPIQDRFERPLAVAVWKVCCIEHSPCELVGVDVYLLLVVSALEEEAQLEIALLIQVSEDPPPGTDGPLP